MIDQFISALRESVQELAETMLFLEIEPGDAELHPARFEADFSSVVRYSGALEGSLCLAGPEKSILILASALMGEERPNMDPEMEDGFSEICNIIGGGLQTRLEPTLGSISMTPPVVISGPGHEVVRDPGYESVRHGFSVDGKNFFAEVFFVLPEGEALEGEEAESEG